MVKIKEQPFKSGNNKMQLSVLGKKRSVPNLWGSGEGSCLAQIQSGIFGQERLGRERRKELWCNRKLLNLSRQVLRAALELRPYI